MIEQGRLILTMMPSLHCKLDCPHCYLTQSQRRSKDCLGLEQIKTTVEKINHYYQSNNINNASIEIYWYGGEPTTMEVGLFGEMCDIINHTFKDHQVKHTLLSALVGVDLDKWSVVIKKYCNGKVQTSYDGLMRGVRYDKAWQKQVLDAHSIGLRVNTLSVFNKTIEKEGYHQTFMKLSALGIRECGWLPFQKNISNNKTSNNKTSMFDKYSTTMHRFSDFMIDFTTLNDATKFEDEAFNSKDETSNSDGKTSHSKDMASNPERQSSHSNFKNKTFLIGNELFINSMNINGSHLSNTGTQTLFLMPSGDLVMPDYDKDNIEFMKVFGNILTQSFEQILTSKSRRDWRRKQLRRNHNQECLECNRWNCCLMEFWKDNNPGDDCYGAKRYVDWLCATNHKRFLPDGVTVAAINNTQKMSAHTAIKNIA